MTHIEALIDFQKGLYKYLKPMADEDLILPVGFDLVGITRTIQSLEKLEKLLAIKDDEQPLTTKNMKYSIEDLIKDQELSLKIAKEHHLIEPYISDDPFGMTEQIIESLKLLREVLEFCPTTSNFILCMPLDEYRKYREFKEFLAFKAASK